jgi:hypothetical protein
MERQFNKHHALWQRRWYKSPAEKAIRGHQALVIPKLWVPVHKQLHAELQAPPKPPANLIYGMLSHLEGKRLTNPIDGIRHTIDYLDTQESSKAERLEQHLIQQLGFIMLGVGSEDNKLVEIT